MNRPAVIVLKQIRNLLTEIAVVESKHANIHPTFVSDDEVTRALVQN